MTHTLNDGFSNEAAIDAIIATCDGDTRGAISVLLHVNKQLVTELQQVYSAFEHGSPSERRVKSFLH